MVKLLWLAICNIEDKPVRDRERERGLARLKVFGALPPQSFGQSRLWRYQLATATEALAEDARRWG